MKQSLIGTIALSAIFWLPSCKDVPENDGKTRVLQDSMINVFPTWQALKIKVDDDRTKIKVVIGDVTFYKTSADQKAKKAEELGKMIVRIYGNDCILEQGTLIVTSDVRNESEAPADGIVTPIDIATLKTHK